MAALVSVRAKRVQVALGCIYPSLEGTPKIQPTFLGAHSGDTVREGPSSLAVCVLGRPEHPRPQAPTPFM